MRVHRLESPFKHWVSGLLAELAVFAAYIALVALVVAAIVRVR